jgi:hypothetical protein
MKTEVRKNKFGRGVYAKRPFRRGEVVEVAPVVVVPKKQIRMKDKLIHYVFEWNRTCYGVALGYGSLFNHSDKPDVEFSLDRRKRVITFRAVRPIRVGQEVMTSYGYDPRDYPMKKSAC